MKVALHARDAIIVGDVDALGFEMVEGLLEDNRALVHGIHREHAQVRATGVKRHVLAQRVAVDLVAALDPLGLGHAPGLPYVSHLGVEGEEDVLLADLDRLAVGKPGHEVTAHRAREQVVRGAHALHTLLAPPGAHGEGWEREICHNHRRKRVKLNLRLHGGWRAWRWVRMGWFIFYSPTRKTL